MRKKLAYISAILMMAAVILAGCGKGSEKSEAVGTWKAKTIEAAGVTMDMEEYAKQVNNDTNMTITFKEDKSFTMKGMGAEGEGTWKEKDGAVTATLDGEDQIFKIKDGKLIFENEGMGDAKIFFEK